GVRAQRLRSGAAAGVRRPPGDVWLRGPGRRAARSGGARPGARAGGAALRGPGAAVAGARLWTRDRWPRFGAGRGGAARPGGPGGPARVVSAGLPVGAPRRQRRDPAGRPAKTGWGIRTSGAPRSGGILRVIVRLLGAGLLLLAAACAAPPQ